MRRIKSHKCWYVEFIDDAQKYDVDMMTDGRLIDLFESEVDTPEKKSWYASVETMH